MEITRRSKLLDVLRDYPFLEAQIIDIAPPFKNLRNPVLRRTVGQLATIERVAQIGNLDVVGLVNSLRLAAGQGEVAADMEASFRVPAAIQGDPEWISGAPQCIVDGNELLDQGEVPLQRINTLLGGIAQDGYILLTTNFEPTPIIDALKQQGRSIHHKADPGGSGQHFTYVGTRPSTG